MADIMGMDELETFVLDFLAYRREQRMKTQPAQNHVPKRIELKDISPVQVAWDGEQAADTGSTPVNPQKAGYIPPTIGRGWPHYRGGNPKHSRNPRHHGQDPGRPVFMPASQNDVIPALAPIVAQVLTRFGPPTNPNALDHLINQVIAGAIELPPVSESIQTAEIKPWGRVALLQAVIELLIRISTM
ncbi:MAG: hypothetical protein FWC77_01600 [Defluviitaleaceae bacterium]|nr:hypothetical protein [Defluviitaleaceae bacterium]